MSPFSRREFLEAGSSALAGAGLQSLSPGRDASSEPSVPPINQLQFGVIGVNGMGWANTNAHQQIDGVDCVALCDVDRNLLEKRAGELETQTGTTPEIYDDYRRLLENDEVDFVIIATPDHWHCRQLVDACQAGKDVYVEKPLANSIAECRAMQRVVEQTGRVVQVGQWQRSSAHWQSAIEYLQSDPLGTVRTVKAWAYQGWMDPVEPQPNQDPPDGVDYEFWLGPAPKRPFNPNRFHFDFRWFWDYAGGLMTDWGVHLIDYGLHGMTAEMPNAVASTGGQFGYPPSVDASETPDTQQAFYEFDDFSLIWEHATGIDGGPYDRNHGVAFIGNNGALVIDRGGWEVIPEAEDGTYKTEALPPRDGEGGLDAHARNFVASIRGEETPNCPVDVAANTAVNAHLGNIAFRVGRKVAWDADQDRFEGDSEANDLVRPAYREPWSFPNV